MYAPVVGDWVLSGTSEVPACRLQDERTGEHIERTLQIGSAVMENLRNKIANILSAGFWSSLIIAFFSALEFSWLNRILDDPLISALLTLVTPLPFASFLAARRRCRTRALPARRSQL
jgi:hypothetical protein